MSWSGHVPRSYRVVNQQQSLAFLPCAPGCEGSRNDPRYCQCVCQGINHGRAWTRQERRPVPVPYGFNPMLSLHQEPEALPDLSGLSKPVQNFVTELEKPVRGPGLGGRVGRKIGRSFAKAMFAKGPSETEMNEEIMIGLRKQFSQERVDAVIDQAFSLYFSQDPDRPRPELYELYETGIVDKALELFRVRWVTGRPKRR
jgi:hypothetical protein